MINKFEGNYAFLSNFYICDVHYNCHKFRSAEAAFQAAKCPERYEEFLTLGPKEAKSLGRKVELRYDWEHIKDLVMYEIVYDKFTLNEDLKQKLLATDNEELVEGNHWHDTYWGVCNGVGQNKLGKILMRVREKLRQSL